MYTNNVGTHKNVFFHTYAIIFHYLVGWRHKSNRGTRSRGPLRPPGRQNVRTLPTCSGCRYRDVARRWIYLMRSRTRRINQFRFVRRVCVCVYFCVCIHILCVCVCTVYVHQYMCVDIYTRLRARVNDVLSGLIGNNSRSMLYIVVTCIHSFRPEQ